MKRTIAVIITFMLLVNTYVYAESASWVCPNCGNEAKRNFCSNCGTEKPLDEWICPNCGNNAKGNFCSYCGSQREASQLSGTSVTDIESMSYEETDFDYDSASSIYTYSINSVDLSTGIAWVDYNGYELLINKEGIVLYCATDATAVHSFGSDELSFIESNIDGEMAYTIIDRNGRELYTLQNADGISYEILCCGDYSFLIYETSSDFSGVYKKIYVIDEQANTIGTSRDVDEKPTSCVYAGDGIYILSYDQYGDSNFIVFNTKNDSYFSLSDVSIDHNYLNSCDLYPFYNGISHIAAERISDGYFYYYGSVSAADFESLETWEQWLQNNQKEDLGREGYSSDPYYYIGEGYRLFDYQYDQNRSYFMFYDDIHLSFPTYPDAVSIDKYGLMNGGYMYLKLIGGNGKPYITVIDKNGNQMYDPIELPEKMDGFCAGYGSIFYYVDGSYYQIDIEGQEFEIGVYDIGEPKWYDGEFLYGSDGIYDMENDCFLTLYILPEMYEGTPLEDFFGYYDYEEATEGISPSENTYISVDTYTIEGKWKNIGEETVGQIQRGSIVAFDGKNCNVYSPADTYAFYKNGDDFKLDCTSMLFSDTLSFTVKIVDDNHVDLYTGSRYIELERVG